MKEVWKEIKGFEGVYNVSNLGRVMRIKPTKGFAVSKKIKTKNNSKYIWGWPINYLCY